jgi:hypothetical protein
MSWRDQLRPASLGGVRFHVVDRGLEFGRRHHNHEYPKRDDNFAEDMGRTTRKWNVKAYLVGDDYMARRDRLIQICEREGPHQYVDRWGRSHQVVVEPSTLQEAEQDGRYCTFDLALMAAGSAPSGVGIAAAVAQVIGGAEGLAAVALGTFASLYLPGQLAGLERLTALQGLPGIAALPSGLNNLAVVARGLDLDGAVRQLVPAAPLNVIASLGVRP